MEKYLIEFRDVLLELYDKNYKNYNISSEDDNSFLNGIVFFLSLALSESLYNNKIPLKNITCKNATISYDEANKLITYIIPLISDVSIKCGICLLTTKHTNIEDQKDNIKELMQDNNVRGVFVEFLSVDVHHEMSNLGTSLAPTILNKIIDNPIRLN